MLSALAVTALSAVTVLAQQSSLPATPATPLIDKHFNYPSEIPYKVDTDQGLIRGNQFGYNICNSSTEGKDSLCQTAFMNSIDDFCLWAPAKPNSLIADTEGEEVAHCTKPGRGTRIINPNAILGLQFMRTPDYIQVVGFIDQSQINIASGDSGGELDPHGADLRGNPLGGLLYSNAFPAGNTNNNSFTQVMEWHNFMGGSIFCLKACDPAGPNAANYCQHVFDRIGSAYNCPAKPTNGTFEMCLGDNQDFPGVYTSNGAVVTYSQPPESLGPISSIPYTARIPASSSCTTFARSTLFAAASSWYSAHGIALATTSSSSKATTGASNTRSGSSSTSTSTGNANSGAMGMHPRMAGDTGAGAAVIIGLMGVLFATMLLA